MVATIVALVILSIAAPEQATSEAWGHAIVVALFAILLPLRARSARRGSPSALRAVGVIAAILLAVNVVEALIPGFVPLWMKIQMMVVAVVMDGLLWCVVRARR